MSNNAKHDENGRPAGTVLQQSDGATIIPLKANAATHALKYDDGTTGSDNGNNAGIALVDENGVPVFAALSSNNDGVIVNLYGSTNGGLLLKST